MHTQYWDGAGGFINMPFLIPTLFAILAPIILLFVFWSIVWKGLALWHAARRGEQLWFVALLVINTAGILEIIYLFFVAKLKLNELFTKKDHHHE